MVENEDIKAVDLSTEEFGTAKEYTDDLKAVALELSKTLGFCQGFLKKDADTSFVKEFPLEYQLTMISFYYEQYDLGRELANERH